jgi:hypothetical protein
MDSTKKPPESSSEVSSLYERRTLLKDGWACKRCLCLVPYNREKCQYCGALRHDGEDDGAG